MSKNNAPEIEKLKFSQLIINNLYSGRSQKEINENAKEKAKELAAFGGWNPAMPGQYFVGEDGKPTLLAGFSRVQASINNGEDCGYFVKVDGDEISRLLACETSNSVKTLSPLARGARYTLLNDGEVADDFAEKNEKDATPDPKIPEHWKRQPMSQQEIADRIGLSNAWVCKCIAIFKAPPEIRDMIESDKIAAPVAEGARILADKHYKGSDAKAIAICRAAYAAAKEDGKDTATKKHFDAIKANYIPVKPFKAAKPEGEEETAGADNKSTNGSKDTDKDNAAELPGDETGVAPADTSEAESLFQQQTAELLEEDGKQAKALKKAWRAILEDPDKVENITLDKDTVNALVDELHAEMVKLMAVI